MAKYLLSSESGHNQLPVPPKFGLPATAKWSSGQGRPSPSGQLIVTLLLDNRNRFDTLDERGFCHHCHEFWNAPEDERCDTCAVYKGEWHEDCECKKDHRFGPVLLARDPRLQKANFAELSLRERVKKLLGFHQVWCVSNFLKKFPRAGMYGDLGAVDSNMINLGGDFSSEMAQYNTKIYNFTCNLVFIGWAHKGLSLSAIPPGTYDPYRSAFLGQLNAEDWNGGHRETFHEISTCFVECHQPAPGEKPLSPDGWSALPWRRPYAFSNPIHPPKPLGVAFETPLTLRRKVCWVVNWHLQLISTCQRGGLCTFMREPISNAMSFKSNGCQVLGCQKRITFLLLLLPMKATIHNTITSRVLGSNRGLNRLLHPTTEAKNDQSID